MQELLRCDANGNVVDRVKLGGWTRGVTTDQTSVYVGVSAHLLLGKCGTARIVKLDRLILARLDEWELPCPKLFAICWIDPSLVGAVRNRAI